jgi:hypothetical protein
MKPIHAQASRTIQAPAETLYNILRDYHTHHPAILPTQFFKGVQVHQGGQGAGTIFDVTIEVYGNRRVFHMEVTEPTPGRVLVETDHAQEVITTFTVQPVSPTHSQVTIATDSRPMPGVQGWFEKWFSPAISRRIYSQELAQLESYAQQKLAR